MAAPDVPGVAEVFHAQFTDHAYPLHTHDTWTLLIVDDGVVRFDLDRHEHGALPTVVTLLPPHVPHDGRAATAARLPQAGALPRRRRCSTPRWSARAVDAPGLRGRRCCGDRIDQLHAALRLTRGDALEAESRLALIGDRLRPAPRRPPTTRPAVPDTGLADRLRDLLDAAVPRDCRCWTPRRGSATRTRRTWSARSRREFGLPPHRYLTGRRVDLARRLLLDGQPPAAVATEAGFYDQSHLTRHFTRMLGTTPSRYVRP